MSFNVDSLSKVYQLLSILCQKFSIYFQMFSKDFHCYIKEFQLISKFFTCLWTYIFGETYWQGFMCAAARVQTPPVRDSYKGTLRHDCARWGDTSWGERRIPQADSLRVQVDSELEQHWNVAVPLPQLVPTVPQALADVEGSAYDQTLGPQKANANARLPLPAPARSLLSRIDPP